MPNYTLTIELDSTGVSNITNSGQFVTLVKSIGNGTPVAWVSFLPGEMNTVTWEEQYSVYASTTNNEDGAKIVTSSSLPAAGGDTYTFSGGVFTQSSTTGIPSTAYGVINQDSSWKINGVAEIVTGLYQGAVVNGSSTASPLNASTMLYTEGGTFTPIEKVQVFLSGYADNGYVITQIAGNALEVDFTSTTSQTIYFSDQDNVFLLGSLPSLALSKK